MQWLVLAVAVLVLECQNLLALWHGWVLEIDSGSTDDYTVVVPVYGDPKYFRNAEGLRRFRDQVLILAEVTPPAMQRFADRLEADGWRVHRSRLHEPPGPERLMKSALDDGAVHTGWLVRIDADTVPVGDFGSAVAAARDAGADLCSVKCLVAHPKSVCERVQAVEYAMAMRTRHFRPWMTSGACTIGTTAAYRTIIDRHSLVFGTCGGDIEAGRIANNLRMRVRHVDFTVLTEVPESWTALFRQRMVWWAASFRSVVINLDSALRLPLFVMYFGALVWLALAARLSGMFEAPRLMLVPLLILAYTGICFITNWPVRSRWMIVFPYYSLLQVLLMPLPGIVWCLRFMVRNRTTGRYSFGFRRGRYERAPLKPVTAGSS